MILPLLFFCSQIFFGYLILDYFDFERKFNILAKIGVILLLGQILSGFFILIFSIIFASLELSIIFFEIFLFLSFFILKQKRLNSLNLKNSLL